jgi:hypothetical protein
MSTLLAIEVEFLRNSQVEQALDLRAIRSLQRTLANGQKKKFAQTLELSKKVVSVANWFTSEEGKQATAEAGIYWNNETIGLKVFGWQKSYYYKVLKAGKLDDSIIEEFNSLCDEAEANGEEPNRSLEGLLKFTRSGGTATAEAGGTGEDGEETEETTERAIEVRIPTIFTMTYKGGEKNVSVRVNENNEVATTNSRSEILAAIEFLTNLI